MKAHKDVRVATNVGTDADVTLSSGSPEKRSPQRRRPAQGPRIDLPKLLRLLLRKPVIQNCVLLVLVVVAIVHNCNWIMLKIVFLLVLVDNNLFFVSAPKRKKI